MDQRTTPDTPKAPALACDDCGKVFARPEHLRRHISTSHNVDRKYPCDTCGKEFVRRDALQRHTLTHQNTEPNLIRRGGRACTSCSSAKARCTGEEPHCSRCLQRDIECTYPASSRKPAIGKGRTPERRIQPATAQTPGNETSQYHMSLQQPTDLYETEPFDPQYWNGVVPNINWLPLDLPEYVDVSPTFDDNLDPFAWANAYNVNFDASVQLQSSASVRIGEPLLLTPQDPSPVSIGPGPSPSDSQRTRESEVGEYYVDGEPARLPRVKRRRTSTRPVTAPTPQVGRRDFSLAVTWNRLHTEEGMPWTPITDDTYQIIVRTTLYFGQQQSEYSQPTTPSSLFSDQFSSELPQKSDLEYLLGLFAKHVLPILPILHTTKLHSLGWHLTLAAAALGSHYIEQDATLFTVSTHELVRRILYVADEDPRWLPIDHTQIIQLKLLHCIGVLYCGDDRLQTSGQKLLMDMTQEVHLLPQTQARATSMNRSHDEPWHAFIDVETRNRTWYAVWLLNLQQAYHRQSQPMPGLLNTMPPLPCPPRLWAALTAEEWASYPSVTRPSLLSALETLYTTKALPKSQENFCEYSRILLIHGIIARTWSVADYYSQPLSLWTPSARTSNSSSDPIKPIWLAANETFAKWRNSACDCLDVLHWAANGTIGDNKGIEHPTVLHLHVSRVVLLAPYAEIISFAKHLAGEQVSTDSAAEQMTRDKQAIRRWVAQDQYKARLAMIHAGVMFWHVRRFGVGAWYEADAVALAALALWAFSAFSEGVVRSSRAASSARQQRTATEQGNGRSTAADPGPVVSEDEEEEAVPEIILLDRPTDDELVQQFVRSGDKMKAHMTGVGDLYGPKAPEKVLVEAKKILKGLGNWGVSSKWARVLERLISVCGMGRDKDKVTALERS